MRSLYACFQTLFKRHFDAAGQAGRTARTKGVSARGFSPLATNIASLQRMIPRRDLLSLTRRYSSASAGEMAAAASAVAIALLEAHGDRVRHHATREDAHRGEDPRPRRALRGRTGERAVGPCSRSAAIRALATRSSIVPCPACRETQRLRSRSRSRPPFPRVEAHGCISPIRRSGSSAWINTRSVWTRSNVSSGNGRDVPSTTWTVTLPSPTSFARDAVASTIAWLTSTPVTDPVGPVSCAIVRRSAPAPHPISRIASPALIASTSYLSRRVPAMNGSVANPSR